MATSKVSMPEWCIDVYCCTEDNNLVVFHCTRIPSQTWIRSHTQKDSVTLVILNKINMSHKWSLMEIKQYRDELKGSTPHDYYNLFKENNNKNVHHLEKRSRSISRRCLLYQVRARSASHTLKWFYHIRNTEEKKYEMLHIDTSICQKNRGGTSVLGMHQHHPWILHQRLCIFSSKKKLRSGAWWMTPSWPQIESVMKITEFHNSKLE